MQPDKIIIILHAEIIIFFVINLHPVITNRVTIMGYIFKLFNKVPDKVLMPEIKGFQLTC